MDTTTTQSKVAYETGPKEVNTNPRMPNSEAQTGSGNKMPQNVKVTYKKSKIMHPGHARHGEHR